MAGGVTRLVRAMMWLRWRLLLGTLRGSRRRDALERVSRVLSVMVPIVMFALSCGTLMAIGTLGFVAGRAAGTGVLHPRIVLFGARLGIFAVFGFALLLVPFGGLGQDAVTRYTRLLLMPIPRRLLHAIEVAASVTDPWVAFAVPGVAMFAVALFATGRTATALIAVAAAAGIVLSLAAFGSLVAFLVEWLLRSRRRGEVFTLVFVLALSLLSILPAALSKLLHDRQQASELTGQPALEFSIVRFDESLPFWTHAVPSELYGRAIVHQAVGETTAAWLDVAVLWLDVIALFGLSAAVHRRLVESIEIDSRRHRAGVVRGAGIRLPGLRRAASAVALVQVRTAARSVRGRLVLLLPGPLVAILTLLFRTMPEQQPWAAALATHGPYLFGAGGVLGLYAMQAFTMNQFGSDRAGLRLQFLSPIREADLIRGKTAGCFLLFAGVLAVSLVCAILVAPGGPPLAWIAAFLGTVATFLLFSPVGSWMSVLFPVPADLGKTGTSGNPHTLSMLVGTVLVIVLSVPAAALLVLLPPLASFVALAAWTGLALAIAVPLLNLAARALARRRENLALVAQGP